MKRSISLISRFFFLNACFVNEIEHESYKYNIMNQIQQFFLCPLESRGFNQTIIEDELQTLINPTN